MLVAVIFQFLVHSVFCFAFCYSIPYFDSAILEFDRVEVINSRFYNSLELVSAHSSVLQFQFSVTFRFRVLNSVSVKLFCAKFSCFQSSEFARLLRLVFNSAIATNGFGYGFVTEWYASIIPP